MVIKLFSVSPLLPKLRIAKLNACSVCSKSAVIYNHMVENNLDELCVTEIWINNGDISSSSLSSLLPPNYDLVKHYGRPLSMSGGGITIIKHNSINHTPIKTKNFSSLECIGSVITSSHSVFKLFAIYRSPHIKKPFPYRRINNINYTQFNQDISVVFSNFEHLDLDSLVNYFNSTLSSIFDKYAPLKTVTVTLRTSNPWFIFNLLNEKVKDGNLNVTGVKLKMNQINFYIKNNVI